MPFTADLTAALGAIETWPVSHVAAGVAERGGDTPVTCGETEHVFAWASVTKLLTATAVLVAVEEGTVGLDDPAGPDGATVRHLLAHASGLGPDGDAALDVPGRRRIYSNRGFEVVAGLVARRAGMPFDAYLHGAVVEPLGMERTTLAGSPGSGASGSLGDLLRLGAELLEPALVDVGTLAEATAVQFPGLGGVLPGFGRQDPCDWGLGFELRDGKSPHWTGTRNDPATFGHFGRSGTFLWVDPVAGLACAVLTDRDFGDWAAGAWPTFSDAVLAASGV